MDGDDLAEHRQANGIQNLPLVSDLDIDEGSKIPAGPKVLGSSSISLGRATAFERCGHTPLYRLGQPVQ